MANCDAEYANGIAIISCSDTTHDEIIRKILCLEELPEHHQVQPDLIRYPWHIDTKYYSADVNLLAFKSDKVDYSGSIEAIVIHFDNDKLSSFEEVDKWLTIMSKYEADVLLLCCGNCSDVQDKAVKKETVFDWCLKNHFELVELYPTEEEYSGDDCPEDDFKETKGYDRINQALMAHTWSDLILKEPPAYKPKKNVLESLQAEGGLSNGDITGGSTLEADPSNVTEKAGSACATQNTKEETPQKSRTEKIDSMLDEDRWLFNAVGKEDPGSEPFESLFQRILSMKEKAQSLEGEERKLYAEKVAVEFWRALGGDEDEIAGLDSDEN